MEYVQERIATLHDYGNAHPRAPTDRASVVVPMTERDHATLAAERVFGTLADVDPGRVVVALRASPEAIPGILTWLEDFELETTVLWCTATAVEDALADSGITVSAGKGRDVWLALGIAADAEYVVVHDADATNYAATHVPKLLYPIANGYDFTKGYYARVENRRLYGRLARLFIAPLLRALQATHAAPILEYLAAFRYPLSGEFALTGELATQIRAQPGWGLELGSLGEAFEHAGFGGSAQVDLGVHKHEHRAVAGPDGLGDMATEVGEALLRAVVDHGLEPDLDAIRPAYVRAAEALIDQYAVDAAFNGLEYDPVAERDQVDRYAEAIAPLGTDCRLPAWETAPIDPDVIAARSADAIAAER
ncbi:MAG: glycosyl transferase family 2 [Salinirussus sp.]